MKALRRFARGLADAAAQLTLPLTDPGPPAPRPGKRLIRLEGQFIEYELRRTRRRTIGLSIDDRGLTVSAPRWVSQNEIEATLAQRERWVLRKLVEWREHAARRAKLEIRWEHGATIPFLGTTLRLSVEPALAGVSRREGELLRIGVPSGADTERIRDSAQGWIQQQARAHFEQRVAHFSAQLGVAPRRLALSAARTRWGSCTADGSIRLNWRLLHFPGEVGDYVICHELAHLRELNHGPRFWKTVGELFPEYARVRELLRSYPDDLSIG